MKKIFISLLCLLTWNVVNAIELGGTHIQSFMNHSIYCYATLTIDVDGNNVTIHNFFRRNQPIHGTYDETSQTLTIPAGQLIETSSNGVNYYLYTYTLNSENKRVLDKTSDIVFNITEYSSYNSYKTEQNLVAMSEDMSSYAQFTNVSYRNYQNAVLQNEILDYTQYGTSKGIEEYPVYVEMVGEGKYLIRNFDQKGRLYLYTHRDGSFNVNYGDYPVYYTSALKNYWQVASVIDNGSKYSFSSDLNLHGQITDGKVLTLNNMWLYRCDNRENTEVSDEYKKIWSAGDVHKNMTITLNSGKFNLPHVAHEATAGELVLLTQSNFLNANAEGWMWSGNTIDDSDATIISNKKSTIEPGTDNVISATVFEGLNLKYNNEKKTVYMRVKGLSALKFYVTSNGSPTRTASVTLTPTEGESITRELAADNKGAVDVIEGLDKEKTYDIMFSTVADDMVLYAVQFLTSATGIAEVQEGKVPSYSAENTYDLQGRMIQEPVKGGLYIRNNMKIAK